MNAVKDSPDIKADDILRCMKGEFAFYVENNFEKANVLLLEAISLNDNKSYPKKSLQEIYRKKGLDSAFEELNSNEDFDEEER